MWEEIRAQANEFLKYFGLDWTHALLFSILLDAVVHGWIISRQTSVLRKSTPPESIQEQGFLDEKTFRQGQEYSQVELIMDWVFEHSYDFMVYGFVATKTIPVLWSFWAQFSFVSKIPQEISVGILMFLSVAAITAIGYWPLTLFQTFVVEEKFGFNKTTLRQWLKDQLLFWLLGSVYLPLFRGGQIAVVWFAGENLLPASFLFTLTFVIATQIIFPIFVIPLYYKSERLGEGDLRTALVDLADSMAFPSHQIFVVDGSTRSSHSNAFVIGIPGFHRIFIFDTLISGHTQDEIVAVLAHELGHWKNHDMLRAIAFEIFQGISNVVPLLLILDNTYYQESLGFNLGSRHIAAAILLQKLICSPFAILIRVLAKYHSRRVEYKADSFATNIGRGEALKSALIRMSKENKNSVESDWIYSAYQSSHPSLPQRLSAIDSIICQKHQKSR